MSEQQKTKVREWWIVHECESGEGFAYEHPCASPQVYETHVIEYSAYQKCVEALKEIAKEFGTDYADGNTMLAHETLKQLGEASE